MNDVAATQLIDTQYDAYKMRRFFGSLDGIRAISILAVLWHHTRRAFPQFPISDRGWLGVDMFFVLSGYLIVTLLLREKARTGDISYPKFFMRRVLRIFPLYYGIVILLAILFGVIAPNNAMAADYMAALPFYLTYTSNWIDEHTFLTIAWSLATEEQFYVVWPPIEKYFSKVAVPIMIGFILLNQLVNFRVIDSWLNATFGIQHANLDILQSTFTPICFGVLLAHAMHQRIGYSWVYRLVGNRWASVIIGAILLVFINYFTYRYDMAGLPRLTIHVLMTALLASVVVREDHALKGFMTLPPLVRIGQISYGMYLWHIIMVSVSAAVLSRLGVALSDQTVEQSLLMFPLTLVLTYIIAELSFRFFETPFLNLKSRWSTHY